MYIYIYVYIQEHLRHQPPPDLDCHGRLQSVVRPVPDGASIVYPIV